MKKLLLLAFIIPFIGHSQFADYPESGNSNAIHKDSSILISWATGSMVQRGKQDIAVSNSPLADYGTDSDAIGAADNQVVSLGDSGVAILTFATPITNGTGPDFAVFENSFSDVFLELAFVEVSSDGNNYFRFPATCNLPNVQIGGFDSSDPTKLNNLAGKYRAEFGTPFDLDSLEDNLLLDKNSITHVKIIDAIGDISGNHTTYDQYGNPVNDPYPTEFGSGGFDLDGVAVIHEKGVGLEELEETTRVYPNPVAKGNDIFLSNVEAFDKIHLIDVFGNVFSILDSNAISTNELSSGIYFIQFVGENESFSKKVLVR